MINRKVLATVAGTVGCALAIGFIMQATTSPPRSSVRGPATVAALAPAVPIHAAELELAEISLTSSLPDLSRPEVVAEDACEASGTCDAKPAPPKEAKAAPAPEECTPTLRTEAAPNASVGLSLDAPCHPNDRLTLHHGGLSFTATTDTEGRLDVTVPALSASAVFVAEFDDGTGVVGTYLVEDLDGVDRIVLQWSGSEGFEMHAREFGASYGSAGHVWSGSPQADAAGGRMILLGDPDTLHPRFAEVYTFPTGTTGRSGTVDLTVEAEVTKANCGRDITAQSIELRRGARPSSKELVLSVPDCDSVGDFLVLNNLLDDLKIAGTSSAQR